MATKASIIRILVRTAVSLFNIAESMATPCSVNANGLAEECFNILNRSQFATSSKRVLLSSAISLY